MKSTTSTGRRMFLKTAAVAGAGALLAGCTSSGTKSGDGSSDSGSNGASANNGSTGGASSSGGAATFGGWLDGTNYDGSVTDKTGASDVTIKVGAEANSGMSFAPPAVKIKKGTTVTWKWTGDGGAHNVVAKDGSFKSKLTAEKGHTFTHTFDGSGTYKYFCAPHKAMGMKGVVVVK